MHRPDTAAHADGAGARPGPTAAARRCSDHARGDRKGDKCGKDGDQDRYRDKPRFVASVVGVRRIPYRKDIDQMSAEIEQDPPGISSKRQLYCEELERDPVRLKRSRHWRSNWRIPVR